MVKFIKENKLTIAIIVIIILAIFIVSLLTKKDGSSIIEQQNCSKKAEEVYLKNKDSNIAWLSGSDYTNHFNKKMGKCFVLIKGGNLNIEYHSVLYDAYENKELGGVHTLMDIAVVCGLQVGDTYEACKSTLKEKGMFSAVAEFDNLTKFYMEN